MKTSLRLCLALWLCLSASLLQAQSTANTGSPFALPPPTPYSIVQQDANSQVWQRETYNQAPNGSIVTNIHKYTELTTGLNHLLNGKWVASKEEIVVSPDGNSAAATNGQHQVYFPGNIYSGAIQLVTPDGKTLRSQPVGLSYDDGAKSVLIAVLTNATGAILPSGNQVIYQNAFTGFTADLLYTYTKAGFEQDVVIRTEPPTPESLGLNPVTAKLQVLTEFFNPPAPITTANTLPVQAGISLPDQALDFGIMKVGMGHAFMIGDDANAANVLVGKQWVRVGNRQLLVEEAPVEAVANQLGMLPLSSGASIHTGTAVHTVASGRWRLPPPHLAQAGGRREFKRIVAATSAKQGLVLDYQTINSSQTNVTFQGETTYYISGTVNLYGTNPIEGGAVLKFAQGAGATINVKGVLNGDTDIYRPAVLTASADSTMGEVIGGSLSGYYATTALDFDYVTSGQLASLQNLHILYATVGVHFNGGSGHELRHLQLVNCGTAIKADNAQYAVRNALVWNSTNALDGSSSTGVCEHVTFDGVTNLATSVSGCFTNCLLTSVVSTSGLNGESNIVVASSAGVFMTVGSGYHYLTNNSPYRNLGTTNINPVLAAELKKRTTYAPVVLSTITRNTTLTPQAGRDTDLPDVGWHYAPLDYFACGVVVNSNVTLTLNNGVAVGMDYTSSSWGFDLRNAQFISSGLADQFNYVGRAHMSQEKSGPNPGTRACFYDGNSSASSRDSVMRLRFTEFSQLGYGDGYMLYVGTKFGALEWTDSRVYNPWLEVDTSGSGTLVCGITNTLWERGFVRFGKGTTGANVSVYLRDSLARNMEYWNFYNGSSSWTIQDNLFDTVGYVTNTIVSIPNSTNAYYQTTWLLSSGVGNILLTNLTYNVGPLGKYYLTADSPLIDKGSTSATNVGLYHFTTQTNQTVEGTSVVDIGYHYVATDANGNPLDSNGDGIADYLQDVNGNGVYDYGDLGDWQNTLYLKVLITRPRNGSILP